MIEGERELPGQKAIAERAEMAFQAYDKNNDGLVSQKEMARISGKKLSKAQINAAFINNDVDGDGYLNRSELAGMLRKASQQKNKAKNDAKVNNNNNNQENGKIEKVSSSAGCIVL